MAIIGVRTKPIFVNGRNPRYFEQQGIEVGQSRRGGVPQDSGQGEHERNHRDTGKRYSKRFHQKSADYVEKNECRNNMPKADQRRNIHGAARKEIAGTERRGTGV